MSLLRPGVIKQHKPTVMRLQFLFADCIEENDVAYVLDASSHGTHDEFRDIVQFVRNLSEFINIAQDRTRVAAVTYTEKPYIHFALNKHDLLYTVDASLAQVLYIFHKSLTLKVLVMTIDALGHFETG